MDKGKKIADKIKKRIKFLSAKTFELIERKMPDIVNRDSWADVRGDILDLMNQVLRGNKKDLEDCDIVYRPLAVSRDGQHIRVSVKVLDLLRHLEFNSDPFSLSLQSPMSEKEVIDSICTELSCGLTAMQANKYIYYVKGTDCVKLLPVFDRLTMQPGVKKKYLEWKERLSKWYLENSNGQG